MTGSELKDIVKKSPDKAHRAVYDEYCSYVYTVVFSRLRSVAEREDIEECFSDVFADIFLKIDELCLQDDLKPLISTIAQRRAVDCFRHLTRKQPVKVSVDDENVPEISSGVDIAENTEKNDMRQFLLNKIKSLGEPDASIIIMKYFYDRSSSEIAEKLSMKPSAVRMRGGRAIGKLRKILEKEAII